MGSPDWLRDGGWGEFGQCHWWQWEFKWRRRRHAIGSLFQFGGAFDGPLQYKRRRTHHDSESTRTMWTCKNCQRSASSESTAAASSWNWRRRTCAAGAPQRKITNWFLICFYIQRQICLSFVECPDKDCSLLIFKTSVIHTGHYLLWIFRPNYCLVMWLILWLLSFNTL